MSDTPQATFPGGRPWVDYRRPGGWPDAKATGERAWLNVGCGTHYAPSPWWNIDVVSNDNTHPDEVVPRGMLPYPSASCERIMLSHLMEHVPWGRPLVKALEDYRRLLVDGGRLLAIGPDVTRTLDLFAAGAVGRDLVDAVMEHARIREDLDGDWPEARHHWNCTEARMVMALDAAGFETTTLSIPSPELDALVADAWPVVGAASWQAAVMAVPR